MADANGEAGSKKDSAVPLSGKSRGVVFIIVNILAILIIPIVTAASITLTVLLKSDFYTGILKNGRIIAAFVEAKNWQTDQTINDEIERELELTRFSGEFEKTKVGYERAKDSFFRISGEGPMEALKNQRKEIKDIEWKQVKHLFPDEEKFEKTRSEELSRVEEKITRLEDYQDKNRDRIKESKQTMKKALSEYEDALSVLEDKKKAAGKIIEKHKDTLESSIYDDLALIEKPLSKILDTKLINGAVKKSIDKMIDFLTSYDTQVEKKSIYHERAMEAGALGRKILVVRIPDIEVSLWVDGDGMEKRHVMSHLLADEVEKLYNLRNRTLLATMFRYSDSSLGEYFGGKYLAGLGLSINGGVIRRPATELRGAAAENAALIIRILTWGQYLCFATAGLIAAYLVFVFFSTVDRLRKLAALKRLFIYPSLVILAACGLLLGASQYIFTYFPEIIGNLTVRSFVKHLSFTAALHFCLPLLIVFGSALAAGLFMRKYLARRAQRMKG